MKSVKLLRLVVFASLFIAMSGCSSIGGCFYKWTENRNFEKGRARTELNCVDLPLHCALRDGKANKLDSLLEEGRKLEARDGWGRTPLHWCVSAVGDRGLCIAPDDRLLYTNQLLVAGARGNSRDVHNRGALFYAAIRGDFPVARLLLQHGADINGMNGSGPAMPLLCYFLGRVGGRYENMRSKELATLRFLMKHGARIDRACPRDTRLKIEEGANFLTAEYLRTRAR